MPFAASAAAGREQVVVFVIVVNRPGGTVIAGLRHDGCIFAYAEFGIADADPVAAAVVFALTAVTSRWNIQAGEVLVVTDAML